MRSHVVHSSKRFDGVTPEGGTALGLESNVGPFTIKVEGSGVSFECSPESSLLAGMEAQAKKAIAVGCRGGGCGFCKIKVLDGQYESKKMSVKFVSKTEQVHGYALSCRVFPRSDMRVIALENVEGRKIIK